jgi:hypothetical protein
MDQTNNARGRDLAALEGGCTDLAVQASNSGALQNSPAAGSVP